MHVTKEKKQGARNGEERVLAIKDSTSKDMDDWILDSGASQHLASNEYLLIDAEDCNVEVLLAGDKTVMLSKIKSVRIYVIANGQERPILLTNIFAPSLARNITTYGILDQIGFELEYMDGKSVMS